LSWNTGEPNNNNNEDYAHNRARVGVPSLEWFIQHYEKNSNYQPKGARIYVTKDPILQFQTHKFVNTFSITIQQFQQLVVGSRPFALQNAANGTVSWYDIPRKTPIASETA
jgi:hypothetical protein